MTFNSGSAFNVDLTGTTDSSGTYQFDKLNVTGSYTIAASGTIPVLNVSVAGFTPGVGTTYTIIAATVANSSHGTFSGLPSGSDLLASGYLFQISYSSTAVVLTRIQTALTVTPVAVSATYSAVALNNTTYSDNTSNYTITGFAW